MKAVLSDLRHAFRLFRAHPGFTVVAIATLALGISVNTTVFSWIDGFLLRPFPGIAHQESLALVETHNALGEYTNGLSFQDFRDLRNHARLLDGFVAGRFTPLSIGETGRPRRAWGELVTGRFFQTLGVQPLYGRAFTAQEEGESPSPVVVLGYNFWKSYYKANPGVVGKRIRVNRQELTIVGVAPEGFQGVSPGLSYDLWAPLNMAKLMGTGNGTLTYRGTRDLTTGLARIKEGVSFEAAKAELAALSVRLEGAYPATNRGLTFKLVHPYEGHNAAQFVLKTPLKILAVVSILLLLLVCANTANLLLARGLARQREIAIRLALGAKPARVLRQLLTETLALAIAGSAAGLLIAPWMVQSLGVLLPPVDAPVRFDVDMGWRTLGFTTLLCVFATLLCGVAPALFALRSSIRESMESSGRGGASKSSHRLRSALVVSEVALASLSLVGAGLFLRSFKNATELDPGFNPARISVSQFFLSAAGYSGAEQRAFCQALRRRMEEIPGVEAVNYADQVPLSIGRFPSHPLVIPGYTPTVEEDMNINRIFVAPGWHRMLGVNLLQGRDFLDSDNEKAPMVIMVNQTFVDRYFGNRPAVGAKLDVEGNKATIIGVVQDAHYGKLTEGKVPFFFMAFHQRFAPGLNFAFYVKTAGDSASIMQVFQKEALRLNPDAVFTSSSFAASIQGSLYPQRVAATLLGFVGAVCVILAGIGLYSVMSYAVSQRTREMGIRVALGARPVQIIRGVVGEGMWLAGLGLVFGIAAAMAFAPVVNSVLVQVSAMDPLTLSLAVVFLCGVAVAATLLPARRAAHTAPTIALRSE